METAFFTDQQQQIVIGQTDVETLPQQENECEYDRDTESWN